MLKTFNCGIGMILIIAPEFIDEVRKSLRKSLTEFYEIGILAEKAKNFEG